MKKVIVLMCLSLIACGGGGGWPKSDQDKYLDLCTSVVLSYYYTSSEAKQYCDCTLGPLQDVYPTLKDFIADANKDPLPHELVDIDAACEIK